MSLIMAGTDHVAKKLNDIQQAILNRDQSSRYSLQKLFSSETFDLSHFSRQFLASPNLQPLTTATRAFCDQYQISLPTTEQYLSCAMFLFPGADISRGINLGKLYAVDFYLNDLMGREVFTKEPGWQSPVFSNLKTFLSMLRRKFVLRPSPSLVEIANFEALQGIASASESQWFERFLNLYCDHIDAAHQVHGISPDDATLSVADYMEQRCNISGMPHTVACIEFSTGVFLDYQVLADRGLLADLSKMQRTVALIGCLLNDFFSFEKEVMDASCMSNLLTVVAINYYEFSLPEIIEISAKIIRDLYTEFNHLWGRLQAFIGRNQSGDILLPQDLSLHLNGLKQCLQACWTWQLYTSRYKRISSIWVETNLEPE